MAWEDRKGRRYYYGKVREGDKIVSVYLGSARSPVSHLYAMDGSLRKLLARYRREMKAAGGAVDQQLVRLVQAVAGTNFRDVCAYRRNRRKRGLEG